MRPRRSHARIFVCAATALLVAGCSLRDEEKVQPTATVEPVFVIVTPTVGTVPADEPPASYVVQAGDNLFAIATDLGVSVTALQGANEIDDPNTIFVGQVLIVPTAVP